MALFFHDRVKRLLAPFAKAVGADIKKLKNGKQDKLKAGANIHIAEDGTISATGSGEAADLSAYSTTEQVTTLIDGKVADLVKADALDTKLADYAKTTEVQPKLTAGEGVTITEAGVISATTAAPDLTAYVKTEALDAALNLGELDLVAEYEAAKTDVEQAAVVTPQPVDSEQPAAAVTPQPVDSETSQA